MDINEYRDPIFDPKTIAKAHPKYNKYMPALIILGIVILFFIPAATAVPFISLFVLILVIAFIILFVRRRKFISSIFDEINASGSSPSWWNDSNKKYRNLAQNTPQERITQDITHKFARCLIGIPFDIAILFFGFILTFGILPAGICILIFGIVRIILNIKNAHGYYVMNHQDSIREKEAQKQAKQEAKTKKKEAVAMQKDAVASTQKIASTNNVPSQQAQNNSSAESASDIDIMNQQDSIQEKNRRKQAKQEAKAKKKGASAMQKNADISEQKKVGNNNVSVQHQPKGSAPVKSASSNVAKAAVGATAAYVTGKAAGNAIRKTNDKQKERIAKNKQAQDQAYKNQALKHAIRDSQRRKLSNGREEIRISGKTFYITTKSNGSQTLENKGITIGKYDKISDTTTDKSGKKIGKGNLLENIIYDNI